MDIGSWLRELGLERYEQAFIDNAVDAEILPKLTADDLKEIGVVAVGHRRKLLGAIAVLAESALAQQAEQPARSADISRADAGQAERRQLTIMFVDLVGSTELSVRFDPEDTSAMLRAYQNLVAGEITRYEGHIAKYLGDGVLAYFGYPKAHEDEAERAVRAALALTKAVGKLTTPEGETLAARVGIATGLVVVGEIIGEGSSEERAVVGETPNLAARLEALAEPGHVVIAPGTRRLVGELFDFVDLGDHELKGFATPIAAYSVKGEAVTASRFEARSGAALLPIVGRDQELALLHDRWTQAKGGEGQAALLVGEAGIGKSRIARAFLDSLDSEPHIRLRYQCSPYHTESTLWPVIQQLNHAARIAASDSSDVKLDKLEALLQQSGQRNAAPLIADLVGLDGRSRYGDDLDLNPKAKRARTLDALVMQFLGLAATQPVLMVVEDTHWIDPTTLELIEQCLDRSASAPVLILLTSRPDGRPQFKMHDHITELALDRLGRTGMAAIVAHLGGDRLTAETIEAIIGRTDGVPLFVEELTKAMLESGETAVPASLHDTLMTRLDRLPDVKEIAQTAACIGRDFSQELLAAVTDAPKGSLGRSLDVLVASELVFRQDRSPTATYSFKHALVQEAAYQSLLKSKRQRLHAEIARCLEDVSDGSAGAQPEVLAHHHSLAGQTEKAIAFWWDAGRRAAERSANLEAIAHLSNGLASFREFTPSPDQLLMELKMQVALGVALVAAKGWAAPDTTAAFARARELCSLTGDTSHLTKVNWGEQTGHLMRGPLSVALEKSKDMLTQAQGSHRQDRRDNTPLLMAHRTIGITSVHLGLAKSARMHLEKASSLYQRDKQEDLIREYGYDARIAVAVYVAHPILHLGYPDDARDRLRDALADARDLAHAPSLAFALLHNGQFHQVYGDLPSHQELVEEQIALCTKEGFDAWRASGQVQRGCILFQSGQREAGLAEMERALQEWREPGVTLRVPLFLIDLAKALAETGDYAAALARLSEALNVIEGSGERWHEPEIHRLKGELLLSAPEPRAHEAEADFRKAIAVARSQNAKWPELRAATSLAQLLRDKGESDGAYDLVKRIYEWFGQGFDTPALIEAKSLLDDLR